MNTCKWRPWLLALGLLIPNFSHATGWYLETGVGLTKIKNASGLFGTTVADPTSSGFGGNLVIAYQLSHSKAPLQFGLGLKTFYLNSSSASDSATMVVPYPMLRIETTRFYTGFGIAPVLWKSLTSNGQSIESFGFTHAYAGYAELGVIWRVMPFFAIAGEFSMHFGANRSFSAISPSGSTMFSLQMRFRLTNGDGGMKGGATWDGWRYPFGIGR